MLPCESARPWPRNSDGEGRCFLIIWGLSSRLHLFNGTRCRALVSSAVPPLSSRFVLNLCQTMFNCEGLNTWSSHEMLPGSSSLKSLNDGVVGGKVVDFPSISNECRAITVSVTNTRASHKTYRIRPPLPKGNLRLHCLFGEINTRPPSCTFHSTLCRSLQEEPFARTLPQSPDSESWPHPTPSLWTHQSHPRCMDSHGDGYT